MRRLIISWEDIYASSLKFLQPLTPQQTYKTIVKEAIKLLDADQGTVIIYKNKRLVRVYASFAAISKYQVSPHGHTYQVLHSGETSVVQVKSVKDFQPEFHKFGFQSIIFIPFSYGFKTKGVLNIFTKQRVRILKNEAFKLRLFGNMISETLYKTEQLEKTEEAIRARDHFIAMASHELKNPLTAILINAQLIQKMYGMNQIPDKRLLESMVTQTLWLSKLINETLAVGNLKKDAVTIYGNSVSLLDVLRLAISSFKASYPAYTVNVKKNITSSEAFVHADFYKMLQVFVNLLNNAAKFSSNKKPITITIKKDKLNLVTKIKDHGKGISKIDLPRIFDGYYQGGSKDQGGVGLGLFLVKQIVEESKGQIAIKSKENHGTTITISIPIHFKT